MGVDKDMQEWIGRQNKNRSKDIEILNISGTIRNDGNVITYIMYNS